MGHDIVDTVVRPKPTKPVHTAKDEVNACQCTWIVSQPDYRVILVGQSSPDTCPALPALGEPLWNAVPELREKLQPALQEVTLSRRSVVVRGCTFASDPQARLWDVQLIPSASGPPHNRDEVVVLLTESGHRRHLQDTLLEHEQRFGQMLEGTSEGVWMLDADGTTTYVNRRVADMLGYSPEEMVGRRGMDFLQPEAQEEILRVWKQRLAGAVEAHDFPIRRRDGSLIWVLASQNPVRDENGNVVSVVVTLTDITARRQAEEESRTSRRRLQDAQELARLGSYEVDLRTQTAHWSDETYRILEIDPKQPPPSETQFLSHVHPDDRQALVLAMDDAIANRKRLSIEYRVLMPDGQIKYVHSVGEARYDDAGSPSSLIGTILDITERKLAEEALRHSEAVHRESAAVAEDSLAKLRAVVEAMAEGLLIIDTEGNIVTINAAAARMYGLGPADAPPNHVNYFTERFHVLWPDGTPLNREDWPIARAGKGETVTGQEILLRDKKAGRSFVGCYHAAPVRNEDGSIEMVVLTVEDITERKRDEQEREKRFSTLQRALMPSKPSIGGGYSVASAYIPASPGQEIGGDFYDLFRTESGRVSIFIGDVSGKDFEAASVAAVTRSTVRAFAYEMSESGHALNHSNTVLHAQYGAVDSFVTVFLAVLDPMTGAVVYSSAGHPPPAVLRADGQVEFLKHGCLPLGIEHDYLYPEFKSQLHPGDTLLLYTDGVSEARRGTNTFDIEGIERTLATCADRTARGVMDRIIHATQEWSGGNLTDDIAVLAVARDSA